MTQRRNPVGLVERLLLIAALVVSTAAGIPGLSQTTTTLDTQSADPTPVWIWYLLYAAVIVLALRRGREVVRAGSKSGFILAVTAWVLASVVWSAVPGLTLHRAIALALSTLLGLLLAVNYDLDELFELVCWVLAAIVLASAATAIFDPTIGLDHVRGSVWRGLFDTKNELGRIASLTAVMWLLRIAAAKRRLLSLAVLGVAVLAIHESDSRTSLVVVVAVAVAILVLPALRAEGETMVAASAGLVLVLGMVSFWLTQHPGRVLGALGASSTLTGRTAIWSAAWQMAHHHFLFGYGYGAFWRGILGPSAWVWSAVGSTPPHSHNGFLDAWLDLGLVGVVLIGMALMAALASAWRVMRMRGPILRAWPFVFVLFLLLFNITESSLVARNSLSWILFVAVTSATQLELARIRPEAVWPAGRTHQTPRVAGAAA
jgi:O-antigen ligase